MFNSIETNKRSKVRIELVPMIDVMMFLLVFFVLISINVIPGFGLGVNLPTASNSALHQTKKTVVLTIQQNGQVFVGDAPAELETLHALIQSQLHPGETPNLIINGDTETAYGSFVKTLDVLKGAGYSSISIATKKK